MSTLDVSGTGSVINALYREPSPLEPVEGMGCTILMHTDRYAATVVLVSLSKKRVHVARDIAIRTDKSGMSESQSYTYLPGDEARAECYTLRKNGRWVRAGEGLWNGTSLLLGHRRHYHDYSF